MAITHRLRAAIACAAPDKGRKEYHPDAILLEPWAVQGALRRRRGSKALTNEDVSDLYSRVNVGTRVIVMPMERRADLSTTVR